MARDRLKVRQENKAGIRLHKPPNNGSISKRIQSQSFLRPTRCPLHRGKVMSIKATRCRMDCRATGKVYLSSSLVDRTKKCHKAGIRPCSIRLLRRIRSASRCRWITSRLPNHQTRTLISPQQVITSKRLPWEDRHSTLWTPSLRFRSRIRDNPPRLSSRLSMRGNSPSTIECRKDSSSSRVKAHLGSKISNQIRKCRRSKFRMGTRRSWMRPCSKTWVTVRFKHSSRNTSD